SHGRVLYKLPENHLLPVVVAVRMSLSFPVLLSAVPMYAVDFSRKSNQRSNGDSGFAYTATRVWFSDGGISSNMPLHFFDAPLPSHPTFAINLKVPHPDYQIRKGAPASEQPGRVYLPIKNAGGTQRHWTEPDDAHPLSGLRGFLKGIVGTMQSWRDEIQFPYPGYRDRIVQISQLEDEGGLNLNMPVENIDALSDAGRWAGRKLIARFHPEGKPGGGWEKHQEVRVRSFLGLLERTAISMEGRLNGQTWPQVIERLVRDGKYTPAEGALATECLERLRALGEYLRKGGAPLEKRAPNPKPELRISPRM
ncbi:MAG: patatin-like phospholipase family protein, partial [Burkholderiales bacterium]|nr:patatin-like phospholipase family protein [Burkholderiales bacterium]